MSEPCPCGEEGCEMPAPVEKFDAGAAIEEWLNRTNWTLAEIRAQNRRQDVVEIRRRVAIYLHDHGWSTPRIGRFLDRDHTSVHNLLRGRHQVEERAS